MVAAGPRQSRLNNRRVVTRSLGATAWLLLGCGLTPPAFAGTNSVEAELRRNTTELLNAIAPGDVAVWDRLLDPRAIQTDENDVVRDKAQILAELHPLGPGLVGNLSIDEFRVARRGDVAVVSHEDREYLDYHGQEIHSRFRMTDTWVRSAAGWRLLGSQVLAVLADPPAIPLDRTLLCSYTGDYQLTPELKATIRCEGGELVFERTGKPARHFRAEVADVFFEPGAPRTRRIFLRDSHGTVDRFAERREARDVMWTRTK